MNDERLPYHLDSILALALVGFAALVAVTINHQRPNVRVFGFGLAAAGCVAVAGIIGALDWAGQFAELRPPRYAIDPHKPVLMRILAVVFLGGGMLLALVALRQSQRDDELDLASRNEPSRYGRVSRLYHWTIAILVLLLVPMGIFTTMIPYEIEYRQAFYVVHKSVGLTVMLLAAGRIAWLLVSPAPKLSPRLRGWERLSARAAHYTFYVLLFTFPVSGFVLGTSLGKLSHFYVWDLPLFWGTDEASLSVARLLHKLILPSMLGIALLGHVLGAVKHQLLDGHDDAFRRMVS